MSISSHARRNATIIANAYALPGLMTPQLEARLGLDMAETARREGHMARMPPSIVAKEGAASGGRIGGKRNVHTARHFLIEFERNAALVMSHLGSPRRYDDLTRLSGLSYNTLKNLLPKLVTDGRVIRRGGRSDAVWITADAAGEAAGAQSDACAPADTGNPQSPSGGPLRASAGHR